MDNRRSSTTSRKKAPPQPSARYRQAPRRAASAGGMNGAQAEARAGDFDFWCDEPEIDPTARRCDAPECKALGDYRAPKSRTQLNEYFWFCLSHVQAYNKSWDYCRGLKPGQIEHMIRMDVTGWRPTWPLGSLRAREERMREDIFRSFFGGGFGPGFGAGFARQAVQDEFTAEDKEAFAELGLGPTSDFVIIKRHYRVLAKTHHPDANGGDAAHGERLKQINQAYTLLKRRFGGQGPVESPLGGSQAR